MKKLGLLALTTALLYACGGGGGGTTDDTTGDTFLPPPDTQPAKVTVSGFVTGISASYISPVTVRNGVPFRADAVPIGALGEYSVKVEPGDYTFVVMDENGITIGALEDASGNPLVLKIDSDKSLDFNFTNRDADPTYEGSVSGQIQTTTSIVSQLKADVDGNNKWDYLQLVPAEAYVVNGFEILKNEIEPNLQFFTTANGEPIILNPYYRYFVGGYNYAMFEDPQLINDLGLNYMDDAGYFTVTRSGQYGCPAGFGQAIFKRLPVYIIKNSYTNDSNLETFINNTEQAINNWNSIIKSAQPSFAGFVFYGILPEPPNYATDYCLKTRGTVFLKLTDFGNSQYIGMTANCEPYGSAYSAPIYLPFAGKSYNMVLMGPNQVVSIDLNRGNYTSNITHELGHVLGFAHPFVFNECSTPSIMNYSTNGCNTTSAISNDDKNILQFWYGLYSLGYPYVLKADQLPISSYYSSNPHCQ